LFQALIQMNGACSGGLNPGPLGHESSALTTRPRLLAVLIETYFDGHSHIFEGSSDLFRVFHPQGDRVLIAAQRHKVLGGEGAVRFAGKHF